MKSSRVLLAAGSVCLLLAALPARANPGRAVYVNGHNYKVYIDSSGYITASKGEIIGGGVFVPTSTLTSTYKVCRTYNKVPGEGLAVFWDKIYYAYTADTPGTTTEALSTSCSNPGQNKMSVWVAIIDPGAEPPNVISNRAIGAVTINYGTNSASGAAITVFDNQLYLFTDKGIYTSANGTAWTGPNYPFETSYREPLDAVTIYQGFSNRGPRILIVYGYQSSSANLFYSDLWSATWNGKWYPDQQDYFAAGSPFTPANSQQILGGVSLLPGTACNAPLTGTLCGDSWGAREAAVQLFARAKVGSTNVIQRIEFTYGTSLGLWRVAPTTYGNAVTAFVIYPSSAQQCYPNAPTSWDLRQYININWYEGSNGHYGRLWSDALVPQNRDIPIVNCGDMGGSETNTTQGDFDALSIRQGYWTLVGVILGSPQFAQNGYTAFSDYQNFSNVNYGQDINTGVEQTQSMSHSVFVSTGMEVHAGLENVIGIGASFDVSSKHAWESSNGDTTTQQVKRTDLMGTQNSACTELGKWGWALFEAPIMIYQDWKAYAWDYGQISGLGTALNQDLHTIKIKEVAGGTGFMSVAAYFELANPGGPNDQYPGLMSGMQPFSSSLNTSFWLNPGYSWQSDKRWETKLGEGILPQLQFGGGHSNEVSSSESTQSFDSSGYTKDISYTVGASFSAGSKVNGMTAYLKTGYAGSSIQPRISKGT